jgi:hypothetical protein
MSLNLSNYEQAEYTDAPVVQGAPIEPDGNLFIRAIAFGLVGAVLGAVIYAVFVGATGISIGYLAILIAYMIAKGMTMGSHERGGRKYQITAVVLTYLAVAAAHSMMEWWFAHQDGPVPLNLHNVVTLAKIGLIYPVYQFDRSPGSALIGLFILFIGMRAAWRMTSGLPGASHHPFSR